MRLLFILTALALATLIGVYISGNPGYAMFAYEDWTIEMPLWLSVLFILILVISLVALLSSFNLLFSSSGRLKNLWKRRKTRNARYFTYQGLLELAEGQWHKAEKLLSKGAANSDAPLINYLSAAKAAEEAGHPERRDHYIQLAFESSHGSDVLVRLTQAQLQMKHGEFEQSFENLKKLQAESPKHPTVLKLLCRLYESMNDYLSLSTMLPVLKKMRILSKESFDSLEQKCYSALLTQRAENGLPYLIEFWKESPSSVRSNPNIVYDYVKLLIKHNAHDEAFRELRHILKSTWDADLIHLYGLVLSSTPKKQLSFMEEHVDKHLNDPIFLLTLGRLCLRNQLWGKAREYLERSVAIKPFAETYAELAHLMDKLGLKEERDEYFKKGLFSAIDTNEPAKNRVLCLSYQDSLE